MDPDGNRAEENPDCIPRHYEFQVSLEKAMDYLVSTGRSFRAERVPLYGRDAYEASRIDSFLDASLVFARDAQHYLLALGDESFPEHVHARAAEAFAVYIAGIEQGLTARRAWLVGEQITLADICFVAELCLFSNERLRRPTLEKRGLAPILSDGWEQAHPGASGHFRRLAKHPAFAPDVGPYLAKLEK